MKKMQTRRGFLRSLALLSGSAIFPAYLFGKNNTSCIGGKDILEWVVPNAAGGGYDRYSRLIAPFLSTALNRDIVIKNFPGAGGIIGARRIQNASPEGNTFGIINAPGLLASHLSGEAKVPNPLTDFALLAQISSSRQVWITGSQSGIDSMEKLIQIGKERPLICGTRGVSSLGFINVALTANLLDIKVEIVPGYMGSNAGVLAAMRGEVDFVAYNFYSIRRHLDSGDMHPLLQVATSPISEAAILNGVPVLGGPAGVAVAQANKSGKNATQAQDDATAIENLLGAGRILVAPSSLPDDLRLCLSKTILDVLNNPDLKTEAEKNSLQLNVLDANALRKKLNNIAERTGSFIPVIQAAIKKVRQ